ncbi:retron Ec78 anti-phage system effector ATPase PtuA [Pseudomonas sp. EggHat1]|uniref:retron Ec78 anti-phage system effector ATPase PtuA n=1 Tax=Pseudomonas sp. EggHat1 TaxID=2761624 RepID=UPI0018687383|nr:retron Ec78 anti-phage system effector ATPase PtuA [Pseudomonas sp. EggHat1]
MRNNSERNKGIKSIIQNARRGVLEAQLQLHEFYAEGKYVEQNNEEAEKYLKLLELSLAGEALHLKSLSLSNFRRFTNLEITFDKKITVIIGNNGAGKTSISEAISKIFSWFNNNLEKEGVNGKPVTHSDINVATEDYAEIIGKFQLGDRNIFESALVRTVSGFSGSQSSDVSVIKKFGAMYRKTSASNTVMIPLLAFYSVERSFFTLKQELAEKASGEVLINRFSALKDALEGGTKLDNFSELYIELTNLAEGEDSSEAKELRNQISTLESFLADEPEDSRLSGENLFLRRLQERKIKLANVIGDSSTEKYKRHLSAVNQAIENLVPDVRNLRVDRSTGKTRLLVEVFGVELNITQLSQGQRMLLVLAGDIARRLVTLNPEAATPLSCHGVVVIDEVELHLHPRWQQEILAGLQRTFPNLQFIVTTHSPQVLSTVHRDNIRVLDLNKEGRIIVSKPLGRTYGEPSGDVLQGVMLVDPLPPIPEKVELQRLTELVDQGLYDSAEAKYLMEKMLGILGREHAQILRLQRNIVRHKALKQ